MGAKEDAIQTLENSAEDFAEAVWGRDVRQGLVDVANALKAVVEGYATVVTDDLTDADPNAAARAKQVGDLFKKSRVNRVIAYATENGEEQPFDVHTLTDNGAYQINVVNHTYTNIPVNKSGVLHVYRFDVTGNNASIMHVLIPYDGTDIYVETRDYRSDQQQNVWGNWKQMTSDALKSAMLMRTISYTDNQADFNDLTQTGIYVIQENRSYLHAPWEDHVNDWIREPHTFTSNTYTKNDDGSYTLVDEDQVIEGTHYGGQLLTQQPSAVAGLLFVTAFGNYVKHEFRRLTDALDDDNANASQYRFDRKGYLQDQTTTWTDWTYPSITPKIRLCCFGDSVTKGTLEYRDSQSNWQKTVVFRNAPWWINQYAGDLFSVTNCGVETMGWNASDNKSYVTANGLNKYIDVPSARTVCRDIDWTAFDAVYIKLGVNDSGERIGTANDTPVTDTVGGAINDVLDHIFAENPKIRIMLVGDGPSANMSRKYELDQLIRDVCLSRNIPYIDYGAWMSQENESCYLSGTAHPTRIGYKMMGFALSGQLRTAFGAALPDVKSERTVSGRHVCIPLTKGTIIKRIVVPDGAQLRVSGRNLRNPNPIGVETKAIGASSFAPFTEGDIADSDGITIDGLNIRYDSTEKCIIADGSFGSQYTAIGITLFDTGDTNKSSPLPFDGEWYNCSVGHEGDDWIVNPDAYIRNVDTYAKPGVAYFDANHDEIAEPTPMQLYQADVHPLPPTCGYNCAVREYDNSYNLLRSYNEHGNGCAFVAHKDRKYRGKLVFFAGFVFKKMKFYPQFVFGMDSGSYEPTHVSTLSSPDTISSAEAINAAIRRGAYGGELHIFARDTATLAGVGTVIVTYCDNPAAIASASVNEKLPNETRMQRQVLPGAECDTQQALFDRIRINGSNYKLLTNYANGTTDNSDSFAVIPATTIRGVLCESSSGVPASVATSFADPKRLENYIRLPIWIKNADDIQNLTLTVTDSDGKTAVWDFAEGSAYAVAYDTTATYAVGSLVKQNSIIWKCVTAVSTAEAFDISKWIPWDKRPTDGVVRHQLHDGLNYIVDNLYFSTATDGSYVDGIPTFVSDLDQDNIVSVQVAVTAKTNCDASVIFGDIFTYNFRAKMTFEFDDGNKSDYTVIYPYMQDKGVAFVSSTARNTTHLADIGASARFYTSEEAREMIANGVNVISHGTTQQRNLVNFPQEVQSEELSKNRDFLLSIGAGRGAYGLSFPQGVRETQSGISREIRYDALQPVAEDVCRFRLGGGNYFACLPHLSPMSIPDFNYHNDWFAGNDVNILTGKILAAAKYGLWMMFGTHNVSAPSAADPYCIAENVIKALIDAACAQDDASIDRDKRMDVVTITGAYDTM